MRRHLDPHDGSPEERDLVGGELPARAPLPGPLRVVLLDVEVRSLPPIADEEGRTLVTTTGIHVARRIGESLARSYRGDLDCRYADGADSIRVTWAR